MNCIVLSLIIVLFLISLIMDGKLFYELGSSSDRSSDADFHAASIMHLWDVLACIGTEYRCCLSFMQTQR